MAERHFVWDAFVRLFHWSLVSAFVANAFFTDAETSLHHWIGYAVAVLVSARLIWGFVGTRHARFADFPPSPRAALQHLGEMLAGRRRAHKGHSPLGALMIYNLLLTMTGIAVTGYMMTTYTYFGIEWVEDLHKALVTWAEISIVFHVAAVVFESRRLKVNLPKSMVTGYKSFSND